MSLMIAEPKYLEKIWNIRIFIAISEMSSLISKSSMYRNEQLEFVQ